MAVTPTNAVSLQTGIRDYTAIVRLRPTRR